MNKKHILQCSLALTLCLATGLARAQSVLPSDQNQASPADNYTVPESYYNSIKNQATSPADQDNQATKVDPPAEDNTITPVSTGGVVAPENKLMYVETELGQLRQEVDELKKGSNKTAGYDGGFFIKSDDDNFRLNLNFRAQARYSVNIAEDIDNGHTLTLRRTFIFFTGNAYNKNLTYTFLLEPRASPPMISFDLAYQFHKAFNLHVTRDSLLFTTEVADSSAKLMFVGKSILASRYDLSDALGVFAAGAVGKFKYYAAVFNGFNTGYDSNSNNELVYDLRVDFNILNSLSSGQADLDNSPKPGLAVSLAGAFGHFESGTQARLIAGYSDVRFKYRGLSVGIGGVYRQIDPNEFLVAQTDVAFTAQAGYFIIPKKFEIAVRTSALLDDINDAGLNMSMGASADTRLAGALAGGDVNGDSSNEWEYTAAMSYYLKGYNVKLQAQYTYMLDGIAGPDDLVNHIGMFQVQVAF